MQRPVLQATGNMKVSPTVPKASFIQQKTVSASQTKRYGIRFAYTLDGLWQSQLEAFSNHAEALGALLKLYHSKETPIAFGWVVVP